MKKQLTILVLLMSSLTQAQTITDFKLKKVQIQKCTNVYEVMSGIEEAQMNRVNKDDLVAAVMKKTDLVDQQKIYLSQLIHFVYAQRTNGVSELMLKNCLKIKNKVEL